MSDHEMSENPVEKKEKLMTQGNGPLLPTGQPTFLGPRSLPVYPYFHHFHPRI